MVEYAIAASARPPLDALSARELEVLRLTSNGSTNAGVAEALGLTVHAVKFHLASIFRKLGVANRTEAASIYFSGTAVTADGAVQQGGR